MRKSRSKKLEYRRYNKRNDEGAYNLKSDKSSNLDVIAEKMFGPKWFEKPKRRNNAIHAAIWRAVRRELNGRVKVGDKVRIVSLHPAMPMLGIHEGDEFKVVSLGMTGSCYGVDLDGQTFLIYRERVEKV